MFSLWPAGSYEEEVPTASGPESEWSWYFSSDWRYCDSATAVSAGIPSTCITTTSYYYSFYIGTGLESWVDSTTSWSTAGYRITAGAGICCYDVSYPTGSFCGPRYISHF